MNIAIVGGGQGGTAILKSLTNLEEINVTIIIDTNQTAPGITLAKELGIAYSQSTEAIDPNKTDMIIEATGVAKVAKILHDHYDQSCKIIDSDGALLIMTLVERDIKTLDKLNNHVEAIHGASAVVENQIQDITSSVKSIHQVSENLQQTSETSRKYIEESDKIIQYVNKISQQTKILGLNATIEAARAGEHGKGFGVVAKEIQKLATSSENFAREINQLLFKLSDEVKNINQETQHLQKLSTIQSKASDEVSATIEKLNSIK